MLLQRKKREVCAARRHDGEPLHPKSSLEEAFATKHGQVPGNLPTQLEILSMDHTYHQARTVMLQNISNVARELQC